MFFLGYSISSLFVPRLADLYGRRPVLLLNLLVQVVIQCALIFSTSFSLTSFLLFAMGLCASGRMQVSYVYLCEFLTETKTKRFGPFINASLLLPQVLASIAFKRITHYTMFFELFALILTGFVLIISTCFLPESPKYLINKNRVDDARRALSTIARFNESERIDFSDVEFKTEIVSKQDIDNSKEQQLLNNE